MKKIITLLLVSILFISFSLSISKAEEEDVLGKLLSDYGYDRTDIKYDPEVLESLIQTDAKMAFPWFKRWWNNPLKVPMLVKQATNAVSGGWSVKNGLFQEFLTGISRTGNTVMWLPESKLEPYPIDKEEPLLDGIKHIYASLGYDFSEYRAEEVRKLIGNTPKEIQVPLADFLYSAANAYRYRDRALRNWPKEKWDYAFKVALALTTDVGEIKDADALIWDLSDKFDYKDLYYGTIPLIYSIFKIENIMFGEKNVNTTGFNFEIQTPIGKIAFNGDTDKNEYTGDDYLLIVDCGGNDKYLGATAATHSLDHPISVVMDFSGDDVYLATKRDKAAQGVGVFGIGILLDYEGNDTYEAWDNAQAAATWGVGLLWDKAGNDKFKARIFSQGAAQFGVANLVNIGGDDTYYAYYMSQGFGFTGGYGLLLDTEGDDIYTAEPYDLLFPGVLGHNANVNYSLCQGCGFGRRADLYDGHSMGGGFGILTDLKGNDKYIAGIYAQASGYWYATGILYDKEGNDYYDAYFFVQSGTAHMGITELLDEGGDDVYKARQAISVGGAHDVSISWHIDKGGNDKYECWYETEVKDEKTGEIRKEKTSGGILIGSSTANGMGFAINIGGDDTYDVLDKENMGKDAIGYANHVVDPNANTWRNQIPDVGIFIDIGGNDTYSRDICGNNKSWNQKSKNYHHKKSMGLGIDIETGVVPEINW